MSASSLAEAPEPGFTASVSDFRRRAGEQGWAFWRGVLVGFAAAFPIAYVAVLGQRFLGILL